MQSINNFGKDKGYILNRIHDDNDKQLLSAPMNM